MAELLQITPFQTFFALAFAAAVIGVAQVVYMTYGFGAGIIATALLSLTTSNLQDAVVVLMLVCLPIELFVLIQSRRILRRLAVATVVIGIAVGLPIGAWVLQMGEPKSLFLLLSAVLIAAGVYFLVGPRDATPARSLRAGPFVGLISGFLSGVLGTGGPPLVVYFQLQGMSKSALKSNLVAVFFVVSLLRLPSYAALGLLTAPRFGAALVIFPVALLGALVGSRIHRRIPEAAFRRAVGAALLVIAAVTLVVKMKLIS